VEITPKFTSFFNRTVHKLDRRGFIRDWLISDPWTTPANDLDRLLSDSGDPFGKDGDGCLPMAQMLPI
jgi:hypothetical protein